MNKGNPSRHRLFGKIVLLLVAALSLVPLGLAKEWPGSEPAVEEAASTPAVASLQEETVPAGDGAIPAGDVLVPETVEAPAATEPLPMADVWFDDALFIGDSRMEGFKLYAGLPNAQYLTAVGATVTSVYQAATVRLDSGEKISIMDAMKTADFSKVYLMLGLNELGWPDPEQFKSKYGKVLDGIWEIQPEAEVYIQSILPVTAKKDAEGTYINNQRILVFNEKLQELSAETGAFYLDVASAVIGEDGTLPEASAADGVHLQPGPCKDWLSYIKLHTIGNDPA